MNKDNIIPRCTACKKIRIKGRWVSNIGIKEPVPEDFGCKYLMTYCDKCSEKVLKQERVK